jgi:pyruvate,water dikinase
MFVNTLLKYWTYRLFAPGVVLRATYEAFRELLVFDSESHERMAALEALYYQGKKEDFCRIAARYEALSTSVGGMVTSLERMAPTSFVTLREYYRKCDFYGKLLLAPPALDCGPPFVLSLAGIPCPSSLVGGKSSALMELKTSLHLPVPPGFVITVNSCHYLLEYNDLRRRINTVLASLELGDPGLVESVSQELRRLILEAEIPPAIAEAILSAHTALAASSPPGPEGQPLRVAVRSSAVGEDGECSFAGQYTTLLHVEKEALLASYLAVIASKYSSAALAYRLHCGLSDEESPMAVMVVAMVDARASGVVYTRDPAGLSSHILTIHAVAGEGEALVSGRVIPEQILVEKKPDRPLGPDGDGGGRGSGSDILTASQVAELAQTAWKIEEQQGAPQDIEWAVGAEGQIVYLQCRPLRIQPPANNRDRETISVTERPLFEGGIMAAAGQASGRVYCVDAAHPLELTPSGAILVIRETLPAFVQALDRVSGVLAELGSVAGHFSTVCREFGIPLLCGLPAAQQWLQQGEMITMDGESRTVYRGDLLAQLTRKPLHEVQKDLPFYRRLRQLLDTITPLHLLNPQARDFAPESCRSFHDIIRFAHEQAVRSMFSLGDGLGNRAGGRKKLLSNLPFDIFVVDVGGGFLPMPGQQQEKIGLDQIASLPFLALWQGLTHSSIQWQDRAHFDWKRFGELSLADGITSSDAADFASYAVLGADFVHLIMRFGYHFTLVDALCGSDRASNYCQFRFSGGGADFSGRLLRLDFLRTILTRADFQVEISGDLLDARVAGVTAPDMEARLRTLGRLLGGTRLLDLTLHKPEDVSQFVDNFLAVAD